MPELIINGPAGRLEARYHHETPTNSPIALILHPHPQFGGTMNNQVVYALYYMFVERGFSVLRFNFRGVGRSQGYFDNGPGELSDAASALDWLQLQNPDARSCWIAGVSFGTWIAMQLLMRRPEIDGFICVAPPANLYDFSFLAPCPSSGLMVNGDKDRVVPIGLGGGAVGQDQGAEGRQDRARHRARRQPLLPGQDRGPDQGGRHLPRQAHRRDGRRAQQRVSVIPVAWCTADPT